VQFPQCQCQNSTRKLERPCLISSTSCITQNNPLLIALFSLIHNRLPCFPSTLTRMMKGTCMGTFKADYLPSVSLREDVVSIYALCSPSWRRSRVKTTILGCCNIAAASVHNTEGCSFHSVGLRFTQLSGYFLRDTAVAAWRYRMPQSAGIFYTLPVSSYNEALCIKLYTTC
jgi:hypothetical protein